MREGCEPTVRTTWDGTSSSDEKVKLRLVVAREGSASPSSQVFNESISRHGSLGSFKQRLAQKLGGLEDVSLLYQAPGVDQENSLTELQVEADYQELCNKYKQAIEQMKDTDGNPTPSATYRIKVLCFASAKPEVATSSDLAPRASKAQLSSPKPLPPMKQQLRNAMPSPSDTPKPKKQRKFAGAEDNSSPPAAVAASATSVNVLTPSSTRAIPSASASPLPPGWDRELVKSIIQSVNRHHFASRLPTAAGEQASKQHLTPNASPSPSTPRKVSIAV